MMQYSYDEDEECEPVISKEMVNLMQNTAIENSLALAIVQDTELRGNLASHTLVQIKKDESKSNVAFRDGENYNSLTIKVEPAEHFEFENDLLDSQKHIYMNDGSKLEVEVLQVKNIKIFRNVSVDHSHCMVSGIAQDKSTDILHKPIEVLINTENSETISKTEKTPELAYDKCVTKNEEPNIEQDLLREVSVPSGDSNQEEQGNNCHISDDKQTDPKINLKKLNLKHRNPRVIKLFGCDKCEYQTRYKFNLKSHVLKHRNPEEIEFLRCDKCDYQTPYKRCLYSHFLKHKNPAEVQLFKCDKCQYKTRYVYYFRRHCLTHKTPEEVELFSCDKCEFKTRYKSNLKIHDIKHKNSEEVDIFKCNECGYRTRYKTAVKRHLLKHKSKP